LTLTTLTSISRKSNRYHSMLCRLSSVSPKPIDQAFDVRPRGVPGNLCSIPNLATVRLHVRTFVSLLILKANLHRLDTRHGRCLRDICCSIMILITITHIPTQKVTIQDKIIPIRGISCYKWNQNKSLCMYYHLLNALCIKLQRSRALGLFSCSRKIVRVDLDFGSLRAGIG
jgi:hypothetical protein